MVAFMRGALGAAPQKYPGMGFTIAMLAVVAVLLLCVCGGVLVAAMSGGSSTASGLPAMVAAAFTGGYGPCSG
jgi:L-asparagine transporter-like permease